VIDQHLRRRDVVKPDRHVDGITFDLHQLDHGNIGVFKNFARPLRMHAVGYDHGGRTPRQHRNQLFFFGLNVVIRHTHHGVVTRLCQLFGDAAQHL